MTEYGIKLIIATTQIDLVSCVRMAASKIPAIDSIITISKPTDAKARLSPSHTNVILWDMNVERHNISWANLIKATHKVHIIYTSFDNTPPPILAVNSSDDFLTKPAIITTLTGGRYTASIEKIINGLRKPTSFVDSRNAMKMVSGTDRQKIVAVASSTGGTNALESILKAMPMDIPPMVVVQHMPSGFTKLFAERLNAICKQEIREAQTGDLLMRGRVLLAPADKHMRIVRKQGKLGVECFVGARVHGVMPAADILFDSVAELVKHNAVGVVLTGMGNDGARGLLKMKAAGSKNIGQNQSTSVVYGMPKAAKDMGAVDFELPIHQIASKISELTR